MKIPISEKERFDYEIQILNLMKDGSKEAKNKVLEESKWIFDKVINNHNFDENEKEDVYQELVLTFFSKILKKSNYALAYFSCETTELALEERINQLMYDKKSNDPEDEKNKVYDAILDYIIYNCEIPNFDRIEEELCFNSPKKSAKEYLKIIYKYKNSLNKQKEDSQEDYEFDSLEDHLDKSVNQENDIIDGVYEENNKNDDVQRFITTEDAMYHDPEAEFEYIDFKNQIEKVLSTLTDKEQYILKMRLGLEDGKVHTLKELGREYGVTRFKN